LCPRTKEQNDAIRAQRKRQIRDAAAQMLLYRGPILEIRDVALQAGLGYGTVYHYYKNKQELLDELLTHAFEVAIQTITSELFSETKPRPTSPLQPLEQHQRLHRYCERLLHLWLEDHAVFFLYKSVAENGLSLPGMELPSQIANRFDTELYQPLAACLASILPNQTPSEHIHTANYVLGSLLGCAGLHIHRHRTEMNVEGTVAMLLAAFSRKEEEVQ